MAMKKKIAAGIGAVLVTAMCFGGSVFAADQTINGSGNTANDAKDGTTDLTMTYKPAENAPTWSVTMPKDVSFGNIVGSAITPNITQDLKYTATIVNGSNVGTASVASLKVSLPAATNTMEMVQAVDATQKVANAFTIVDPSGNDVNKDDTVDNSLIANLTNDTSATAKVRLNKSAFNSVTGSTPIAYKGSFTVKITPVAGTDAS